MRLEIRPQLASAGEPAATARSAIASCLRLGEVDFGRSIADGDVDPALRDDEVGNLVVAAGGQPLAFEEVACIDVMCVAAVQQQIAYGDVPRKEALAPELRLRSQENLKVES